MTPASKAHWRAWAVFGAWAALWVGVFVAAAMHTYRWGFPLDDAWIHQTYARHVALRGEWAYRAGMPSAGATAPLWVLLQAVGQRADVPPLVWSAFLGWATLTAVGWMVWAWWRTARADDAPAWAWVAGLGVSGSWHLVWAALSGMETALFAAVMLGLVLAGGRGAPSLRKAAGLGAGVGVAAWVRPEAVLLLPALALGWWLASRWPAEAQGLRWQGLLGRWAALAAGFAAVFAVYVGFNWRLSGHLWPNTFYAKQAEYAVLLTLPLPARLVRVVRSLFVGEGALVFPLAVGALGLAVRTRRWETVVAATWAALHVAAYAVRLPVGYQHGRYALPVLPVLLWMGWQAAAALWEAGHGGGWRWVLSRAWAAGALVVMAAFLPLGAQAYARDVAFIESEMVDTAQWMAAHLPAGTRVAAHDIGAVGYFTDFPLVDLAGLVSPEVIPFMRDEAALRRFLQRERVDVLVTFPDWYRTLPQGKQALYANPAGWGTRLGGTHMTVYCWQGSCAILWIWPRYAF